MLPSAPVRLCRAALFDAVDFLQPTRNKMSPPRNERVAFARLLRL